MSDFPAPPSEPMSLDYTTTEHKARMWPVPLVVLALVAVVFLGFSWLRAEPVVVPTASPAPDGIVRVPAAREFTQEELDKKNNVAAFFLGRSQPEGAQQVMTDFLDGTGCEALWSGYQAFTTSKEAHERAASFRRDARRDFPGANFISTGFARIEPGSQYAPAKVMVAGLVLDCP